MIFSTIIKRFKLFHIASVTTAYLLGGGLVQYVRGMRSWTAFIQGLLFFLLLTISVELLKNLSSPAGPGNWSDGLRQSTIKQVRWVIAILAATMLTAATSLLLGWMLSEAFSQGFLVLVVLVILACVLNYFTGVSEKKLRYQIFVEVLLFLILPPAFAFFLQSNDIHWMLSLTILPFIPVFIAYRLLTRLMSYPIDQKNDNQTFVIRIGWEKSMVFHNALMLLVYLIFALIAIFGFPWFLLWPVFLTLPIGLLEIWLMERTRRGEKPLWVAMTVATLSVYYFPMYLIGLAFWVR